MEAGLPACKPLTSAIGHAHDSRMTTIAERMRAKLTASLSPERLEIDDESAKHAGHAGHREGGETHFTVTIVSGAFRGQGRLARQRQVYGLLAAEMAERVHALSLVTLTPEEDQGSR
jgi:BolA protein